VKNFRGITRSKQDPVRRIDRTVAIARCVEAGPIKGQTYVNIAALRIERDELRLLAMAEERTVQLGGCPRVADDPPEAQRERQNADRRVHRGAPFSRFLSG